MIRIRFFGLRELIQHGFRAVRYPGIIVRQHLTVQKQIGLLRERYAESKKVHLQYCCNQVWMKNGGWADSMACYCYLRNIQDLLSDGKTPYERRFGVWSNGRTPPYFCQRPVATASVRQESLTRNILRLCIIRAENLERKKFWSQTLRNWKRWTHPKSMLGDSIRRKCQRPKNDEKYIPDRRWNSYIIWRRSGSENIHLNPGQPRPKRKTRKSSRRI